MVGCNGWTDGRTRGRNLKRSKGILLRRGPADAAAANVGNSDRLLLGKLFDQIFIQTTIAIVASNMTRSGLLYLDQDHIYGCSLGASQANFLSYLATIRPKVAPNESLTPSPSCSRQLPGKQLQEQAPKVELYTLRLSSVPAPLLSPPGDHLDEDNVDEDDEGDEGEDEGEDEDDHTIVKSGRKAV